MVREKKKKKTNVIRINSNRVNKHSYCSKCVYLHIYTPTDVVSFETKLCKFHNFFYFINTDMNALKVNKNTVIYTILHATQKKKLCYINIPKIRLSQTQKQIKHYQK